MALDLKRVREQFPSLNRPAVFFDNPGGTQIARQVAGRFCRPQFSKLRYNFIWLRRYDQPEVLIRQEGE
ncbi:MAG: hypothetical protein AB1750_01515 [Chloroflexota bacterium]